jgi:hypothetical protein
MSDTGKKFHQTTGGKIGMGVVASGVAIFIGVYGFLGNFVDARVINNPTVQKSVLTEEKTRTLQTQLDEFKATNGELRRIVQELQIQVAKLEVKSAK